MMTKKYSGTALSFLLMLMPIIILIIPISTWVLDILIALNLAFTFFILFAVYRTERICNFSLLPTWLLLSINFNLAVNISSVRFILTKGDAFDGRLIGFIAQLVSSQDITGLITCFIIFIVITLIQILIISRGIIRMTKAVSRFICDAVLVKNITIEAEYSAGTITIDESMAKKNEILKEKDFYETLNGACKYVYGYEKIRLIIILLSIIGGILISTMIQEKTTIEAIRIFIPLVIGNGIFSMLPVFLLSFITVNIVIKKSCHD